MSLESKQLCYCDYFAIILSCSHFKMFSEIGVHAVKLKAYNQIFPRCMFKLSSNMVILSCCFEEDGTNLFVSACRK